MYVCYCCSSTLVSVFPQQPFHLQNKPQRNQCYFEGWRTAPHPNKSWIQKCPSRLGCWLWYAMLRPWASSPVKWGNGGSVLRLLGRLVMKVLLSYVICSSSVKTFTIIMCSFRQLSYNGIKPWEHWVKQNDDGLFSFVKKVVLYFLGSNLCWTLG